MVLTYNNQLDLDRISDSQAIITGIIRLIDAALDIHLFNEWLDIFIEDKKDLDPSYLIEADNQEKCLLSLYIQSIYKDSKVQDRVYIIDDQTDVNLPYWAEIFSTCLSLFGSVDLAKAKALLNEIYKDAKLNNLSDDVYIYIKGIDPKYYISLVEDGVLEDLDKYEDDDRYDEEEDEDEV